MNKIKFGGTIKDGKFKIDNPEKYQQYISQLKDGRYKISVQRICNKRSTNQNSLYWVWMSILGNEIGEDAEDMHCTFKSMYLVDRSKKIPIVKSTTSLSVLDFGEYMNKIDRWASTNGYLLPTPEDI